MKEYEDVAVAGGRGEREPVRVGDGGGAYRLRRPRVEQQQPSAARRFVERGAHRRFVAREPAVPDLVGRAHDARYRRAYPDALGSREVEQLRAAAREHVAAYAYRAVDARLELREPPLVVCVAFGIDFRDGLHYLLRDEGQHRGVEERTAQLVLRHLHLVEEQAEVFVLFADSVARGVGGVEGYDYLAARGTRDEPFAPGLVHDGERAHCGLVAAYERSDLAQPLRGHGYFNAPLRRPRAFRTEGGKQRKQRNEGEQEARRENARRLGHFLFSVRTAAGLHERKPLRAERAFLWLVGREADLHERLQIPVGQALGRAAVYDAAGAHPFRAAVHEYLRRLARRLSGRAYVLDEREASSAGVREALEAHVAVYALGEKEGHAEGARDFVADDEAAERRRKYELGLIGREQLRELRARVCGELREAQHQRALHVVVAVEPRGELEMSLEMGSAFLHHFEYFL